MTQIKLIIFDLDGVLVETKQLHYEALNEALGPKYAITWEEHLAKYDGLKTKQKLLLLSKEKNLPLEKHNLIWDLKQQLTLKKLNYLQESNKLQDIFNNLIKKGYKIACCSNSIRKTVYTILSRLNVVQYFDLILANEDVFNSKPHPEIYWTAMSLLKVLPEETLIVEDSPVGLLAANRSNAHVVRVDSPSDLTYSRLLQYINTNKMQNIPKWKNNKLNVLVPMAGAGSRFEQAGYTFPKPLIDVKGKPMIQIVIENLNIEANYIYIVQQAHNKKYNLQTLLNLLTPNCKIIEVNSLTEGAACTALLAKDFINNDNPLFFANSDQFVEWNSNEFMYKMQETNADGGIVTFKSIHPKWSFAKIDNETGLITQVAEKNPISDSATVGFYFWKKGKDFVRYAEQMISKNIRINNEFYVCPVFNEAILDNKMIRPYEIEKMWGLGTPEDLNYYLENYR